MLGERRSPFTDALFALIDLDGNGTIEFDEYVVVTGTYCMYTKEDILKFCFDIFDADGSGCLDEKEFVELCRVVNGASPLFPGNFQNALEQFDVNDDGLIDFDEFQELDRRYPLVLYPAHRLQDTMQKITLGEYSWRGIMRDVNKARHLQAYQRVHKGAPPPDSKLTKLATACESVCCCCSVLKSKPREVSVEYIDTLRPAEIARVKEQEKEVLLQG